MSVLRKLRRRDRQADKLGTMFAGLVRQKRSMGERAGAFAETSRAPGYRFTVEQIDAMAGVMVREAKASVDAPLAPLRAAGVIKVDVS